MARTPSSGDKTKRGEGTTLATLDIKSAKNPKGSFDETQSFVSPPVEESEPTKAGELSDGMRKLDSTDYIVGEELGRGGMGRVYLASDRFLGREIAVKEMQGTNAELEARFVREMLITARLQHPGIIAIYDAGAWADHSLAYTMRKYDGRSLKERLEDCSTLEERLEMLDRIVACAEAITYAHESGVIHRDLKPANIILGEFGETVIIDWGIAKLLDDAKDRDFAPGATERAVLDNELTLHGSIVGTLGYMSPEQARGESVSRAADVYALGACLYELLSGARVPSKGPPRPIFELEPKAPAELDAICTRAMAADPIDRCSAAELAAELRRYQTGLLVSSYRYSMWELTKRLLVRHRWGIAALSLIAVMAVVFTARLVAEKNRTATALSRAVDKADSLALANAKQSVYSDPLAALRSLAKLSKESKQWARARTVAASAERQGLPISIARLPKATRIKRTGSHLVAQADGRVWVVELISPASDSARVAAGEIRAVDVGLDAIRINASRWVTIEGKRAVLIDVIADTRRTLHVFDETPSQVSASADGTVVAAVVGEAFGVWRGGILIGTYQRPLSPFRVSEDGAFFVGQWDAESVSVNDIADRTEHLISCGGRLRSVEFSRRDLSFVCDSGVEGIWSTSEKRTLSLSRVAESDASIVSAHRGNVSAHRGDVSASSNPNGILRITYRGHGSGMRLGAAAKAISISPVQDVVAVAAGRGVTVLSLETDTKYELNAAASVTDIAWQPDGSSLFVLADDLVQLFHLPDLRGRRLVNDGWAHPVSGGIHPTTIAVDRRTVYRAANGELRAFALDGREPSSIVELPGSRGVEMLAYSTPLLAVVAKAGDGNRVYVGGDSALKLALIVDEPLTAIAVDGARQAIALATSGGRVQVSSGTAPFRALASLGDDVSQLVIRGERVFALADGAVHVHESGGWRRVIDDATGFDVSADGELAVWITTSRTLRWGRLDSNTPVTLDRVAQGSRARFVWDATAIAVYDLDGVSLIDTKSGEQRRPVQSPNQVEAIADGPGRTLWVADGGVIIQTTDRLPFGEQALRAWINGRLDAATPSQVGAR